MKNKRKYASMEMGMGIKQMFYLKIQITPNTLKRNLLGNSLR
jgi:hypothetical protein